MAHKARCLGHLSTHFLLYLENYPFVSEATAQKETLHQEQKGLGSNVRSDTH